MAWKICLALVLFAATSTARAAVTVLVPFRDNTIYAEAVGQSNGAGEHLFAGRNGENQTRRGLLAFDVAAAIPAGSTITGASLEMYCTKAPTENGPQAIRLHRLLKSWGEAGSDGGFEEGMGGPAQAGDVTWTQRFFGQGMPWAPAGGEFVLTTSAAALVDLAGFYFTWSAAGMVTDVQLWLDTPAANHGWLLRGNESLDMTVRRFASRQNSFDGFWPRLTVTYDPPPPGSPGETPDGGEVPGEPLRVARTETGELELSWGASCVAAADDYAIYQGPLGSFAAHLPVACSTGGLLTTTLADPGDSVYWLVVPVDLGSPSEGSYGTQSDGSSIPASESACFPQSLDDCLGTSPERRNQGHQSVPCEMDSCP